MMNNELPTPPAQETLKPCPFCGEPPDTRKTREYGREFGCPPCGIEFMRFEKWNRRASEADTPRGAGPRRCNKHGGYGFTSDCEVCNKTTTTVVRSDNPCTMPHSVTDDLMQHSAAPNEAEQAGMPEEPLFKDAAIDAALSERGE